MKFIKNHPDGFIALGLFVLAFVVLALHCPRQGLTRDEGYYFAAAERYAGWFKKLVKEPAQAFSEPVIRRHYEVNREHPVLFKNLMALSFLAFSPERVEPPWAPGKTGWFVFAMRFPAFLFSGLMVALIFLFGRSIASRRVGLFAAAAFFLVPRHFYHAGLACFDMPIAVLWLATIMAYRKSKTSLKWGILTGVVWGLALAVKLNAFFLPIVLGIHWLIMESRKFSISRRGIRIPRIPPAFFSMLILGPLIFFLHWPFIWHETVERIGWYFGFHLHHVHYYWEYFGSLLTEPPFPWLYPLAVTTLTVPLPTLILGGIGFFGLLGERLHHPFRFLARGLGRLAGLVTPGRPAPVSVSWCKPDDAWLLFLNVFIPLSIISLPNVPIFGGVKHWMHAMPFVCLLAGMALDRLLAALPDVRLPGRPASRSAKRVGWALAGPLVLLPSLLGLIHIGSYGTSYYNELAGGVYGAASLGMQRQYWSNNVTGVLPWINQNLPKNSRLHLHEVNGECYHAYKRDGYLRPDLRITWSPDHADFTAYQYHREFVDTEYRIWNKTDHKKIAHGLYIDEVPIVLVYDSSAHHSNKKRTLP